MKIGRWEQPYLIYSESSELLNGRFRPLLPRHQQRGRGENGAVRPTEQSHKQHRNKRLNRVAAKQQNRDHDKHSAQLGNDRAFEHISHRHVDYIFKVHFAVAWFTQVFTDMVEDHDGILQGETNYGENGRGSLSA